jgi:hypothetical protein
MLPSLAVFTLRHRHRTPWHSPLAYLLRCPDLTLSCLPCLLRHTPARPSAALHDAGGTVLATYLSLGTGNNDGGLRWAGLAGTPVLRTTGNVTTEGQVILWPLLPSLAAYN